MKRNRFLIVLIIVMATVFLLSACTKNSTVSKYTSSQTENGETYTYVLTVDEKNKTFSVVRESGTEFTYTGTYTEKNGYLILESSEKGTQYARLVGDEFSFFTPTPTTPVCDHDYVFTEEVPGTCSEKGYKKYVCSKCEQEKTEATTFGDHSYARKSFTVGTCQKKSSTLYECSYCGKQREVDGEYGVHSWVDDNDSEDKGCLVRKNVTRHCSVAGCTAKEVIEVSEEFGSHTYDENGVCIYCLFDKNGLCHTHTDKDENGECDDCKMTVAALNDIRQKGYCLDGETLYFGAYPTTEVSLSPDVLEEEGKLDPVTGYYRYNNASYLIATRYNYINRTNETKVFLVTYLTWTKVATTSYSTTFKCDAIVRYKEFITASRLTGGYHTDDPTKAANDWKTSDLYAFANDEFLFDAFSEKQRELFYGSPEVHIPAVTLSDSYRQTYYTDYAKFDLLSSPTDVYFTTEPGSDPTDILCLHGNSDNGERTGNVTSDYGFVPLLTLSLLTE